MTDFFSDLVERSFGTTAAIRPRVAFLFEPAVTPGDPALMPPDVSNGMPSVRREESGRVTPEPDPGRFDRHEERAADGPVGHVFEPEGRRTIRESTELPDPRSDVHGSRHWPASVAQVARTAVDQHSNPLRAAPASREARQNGDAPVAGRDAASVAEPPAIDIRSEPTGPAAMSKNTGPEHGSLLVPSKPGARVAADLQSSVTATNVLPHRDSSPQREAGGGHAETERHVHVTIGRIEVRATGGDKVPTRQRPPSPVMGLDEYLRHQARRGGQ